MKITYLIITHKNPLQVERLISRLRHEDANIFIHINKMCSYSEFKNIFDMVDNKNIFLVNNRVRVKWGGFEFVQAILNSLQEICENKTIIPSQYIMLLSGQDYPIKSNSQIFSFLNEHSGKEIISHFPIPDTHWYKGGLDRFEHYYFNEGSSWGRFITKIGKRLLPKRRFLAGLKPYGGLPWFCFSRPCVEYILDYTKTNKKFISYFKYVHFPDEILFPTIVLNSPFSDQVLGLVKNNIFSEYFLFDKWAYDSSRPNILTIEDAPEILQAQQLFARKFDQDIDTEILDLIDYQILRTRQS